MDESDAARVFLAAITQRYGPFELTMQQVDSVDKSVKVSYDERTELFLVEVSDEATV